MSDTPWKRLERTVALALGGRRRIARGQNFAISDVDVEVEDFPHWRIDCKYRKHKPFRHHSLVKEIEQKYCEKGDVPMLITKNGNEHGEYITMKLSDFKGMVTALRARHVE